MSAVTLVRAGERQHDRRGKQEVWQTFYRASRLAAGFGALELLEERRLQPGASLPRAPIDDAEIVTYVLDGTLTVEDPTGRSSVLCAGEFQRVTARRGLRTLGRNASRMDSAHIFQLWLRLTEGGLDRSHEEKRFSAAERRGGLCIVASPDSRRGSLRLHQDTLVYSALLEPGQHLVHELSPGRSAWLHLVQGEAALADLVLAGGDGAGIRAERAVSLTARAATEILLLDLADPPSRPRKTGGR